MIQLQIWVFGSVDFQHRFAPLATSWRQLMIVIPSRIGILAAARRKQVAFGILPCGAQLDAWGEIALSPRLW
jgi:hypothetical protein